MAKRRDRDRAEVPADPGFDNPFAALGGLALPRGEAPAAPAKPAPAAVPERRTGKVVLRRQRAGRGGKTVTRIEGLQLDEAEQKPFAKRIKKQLGCGATWEGEDLVLLGDIGERAAELLGKLGYTRLVVC